MPAIYILAVFVSAVLICYGRFSGTDRGKNIRNCEKMITFVLAGGILAICLWITGRKSEDLVEGNKIIRNEIGGGNKTIRLLAEIEGTEEEMSIVVGEQIYSKEEADNLLMSFLPELDKAVLGNNSSFDSISEDLNFIPEMPGYPYHIEWDSGDYTYIGPDGTVNNEDLQQNKAVDIYSKIIYADYKWEYNFSVVICPKEFESKDIIIQKLKNNINEEEIRTKEKEYMVLPDKIEGVPVDWSERKSDSSPGIFALGMIAAILSAAGKKQEAKKREELRNRQLLQEYPDIVSKLTLLIGTGMPLITSIEKLVKDYEKMRKTGGKKSLACEELSTVLYEIQSGVSETTAYTNFGQRCNLPAYKKLSTMLVRGLKKGAGNLIAQLESETRTALEEKKAAARRKGEEAGTKLLLPMMLMLLVVMILIIVPAFGGFTIT